MASIAHPRDSARMDFADWNSIQLYLTFSDEELESQINFRQLGDQELTADVFTEQQHPALLRTQLYRRPRKHKETRDPISELRNTARDCQLGKPGDTRQQFGVRPQLALAALLTHQKKEMHTLDTYPGINTLFQVLTIATRKEANTKVSEIFKFEPSGAFATRNGGESDSETDCDRVNERRKGFFCKRSKLLAKAEFATTRTTIGDPEADISAHSLPIEEENIPLLSTEGVKAPRNINSEECAKIVQKKTEVQKHTNYPRYPPVRDPEVKECKGSPGKIMKKHNRSLVSNFAGARQD